ncbi:hypothetical protein N9D37_00590 [Erythrobacter sp.]|nr:hypothetical protein [Erythrobacter sp.]
MVSAADEINILAGHIKTAEDGLACGIPTGNGKRLPASAIAALPNSPVGSAEIPADMPNSDGCYTYSVNFESDVPMLERRLFRLAMSALPQEQAKKFLDQITEGNAVGAAIAVFNFSAASLDGLHSGAAVHRTGLEIVARQDLDCRKDDANFATVFDAADCMGLPTDTLFVGKHDERGDYVSEVNDAAFFALMRNIRDSCRMIPLGIDDENADLNVQRNMRITKCNSIDFAPRARWKVGD